MTTQTTGFLLRSCRINCCRGMGTLPYGTDQLIDPAMARALHADACRNHAVVAWVVLWDLPAYPERYATRRRSGDV